jgi:hypothetical protein
MRSMRLSLDSLPASRGKGGFTLLEAVMAAGLVLLTITAVTFCVAGVSRAGIRLEERMDGDRAAWRVAERLRVLPFCSDSYPQAVVGGTDRAPDLVEAVFPHADPGRNTASARYEAVAGDDREPAGSFVTLFTEDGVQVTCVACFLDGPEGQELGPEVLRGWDGRSASTPPSGTLSITLSVPGGTRTSFERSALLRPPTSVRTPAAP